MSDLHARGLFNGAVVLGRDGEILYENAWGPANAEAGVLFTPDTPVHGASLAKNFTAAAVWMLVDEGKLDIDAPVQRYVPEYPHATTTVRHLIEHSAGLPNWEDVTGLSNLQLVTSLREQGTPPQFAPGSRFSYCNACYDVATLVVERVSGLAWDLFLRRRVFDRLGMDSTFLRPRRLADWPGVRTRWYQRVDGSLRPHDVADNEGFYGSSNLYFSARDLHRWAASFCVQPVLTPSALARGLEAPVFAGGERSVLNRLSWYHSDDGQRFYFNGHLRGFHHEVYWDADRRLSIVWVTNVMEAKPLPQLLTRALIDVLEGRAPARIGDREFGGPAPGESLAPVAGSYAVDGLGVVTIDVDGDQARLRIGNGSHHDCYGADGFYLPDFDAAVGFSELERGRYQRLHWVSVFRMATGRQLASTNQSD